MMYLQITTPSRRRYLDMVSSIGDRWLGTTTLFSDSHSLAVWAYHTIIEPYVRLRNVA